MTRQSHREWKRYRFVRVARMSVWFVIHAVWFLIAFFAVAHAAHELFGVEGLRLALGLFAYHLWFLSVRG